MVTRHEFLASLHTLLKPRGYFEIGVQNGDSLRLAECPAFGVDPQPMVLGTLLDTALFRQTSDDFFAAVHDEGLPPLMSGIPIDLAFIDGMHLYEFALRDFRNIERYLANERTVVVFDDVLPRNQEEASREQCPGDWTGDVWKCYFVMQGIRDVTLVDTFPTGTMVTFPHPGEGGDLDALVWDTPEIVKADVVPPEILDRRFALQPETVLAELEAWCASR